jgi:hypothetical protein
MESVSDHFAWLLRRSEKPAVFFIDDLDRCDREYVVDLLDAVQTLLRDAPARHGGHRGFVCHVVIAADGRWIRKSYECAHESFADAVGMTGRPLGYLFLDKLFQLTVPVPAMTDEQRVAYLRKLLRVGPGRAGADDDGAAAKLDAIRRQVLDGLDERAVLDAFAKAEPEVRASIADDVVRRLSVPEVEEATEHRLERFVELLEPNPRTMKLILNAYGVARTQSIVGDSTMVNQIDALTLWTILRVRWPALADHLRDEPDAIGPFVERRVSSEQAMAPALARLFTDPAVTSVVRSPHGGPLTEPMIRAFCGVPYSSGSHRPGTGTSASAAPAPHELGS